MREHEIKMVAKECIKNYFKEDRIVMLDESVMRIKGGIFYIYDLIFFGNKIVISTDTLKKIKKSKNRITNKTLSDNCSYLLENIKRDKYANYDIVDIRKYGATPVERIANYLKEHKKVIYLLESKKFYDKLVQEDLADRLKLLVINRKIASLCKNEEVEFQTLGFVMHKDNKMFFESLPGDGIVKIYDHAGQEKKGDDIEVKVGDIILIRSDKNTKYAFNLYEIVTRHSRNFAIKIIWTDIVKGESTNFYVEKLNEKYKKLIKDNVKK